MTNDNHEQIMKSVSELTANLVTSGKKVESGVANMSSDYWINVTGLSFKPSYIIVTQQGGFIGLTHSKDMRHEDGYPYQVVFFSLSGTWKPWSGNDWFAVNPDGFSARFNFSTVQPETSSATFNWVAFE